MAEEKNILKLNAVKTKERYYLTVEEVKQVGWPSFSLASLLFDGKKAFKTIDQKWVYVEKKPQKISKMVSQPHINYRYVLQDKSLLSEKIPAEIKREVAADYCDYDSEWIWQEPYKQYQSLYKEVYDVQPDRELIYNFEINVILEVSTITEPEIMKYKIIKNRKEDSIEQRNVEHQLLDKLIFPSILWHERPCQLSSFDSYQIVRQYVIDNIDKEVATIWKSDDDLFEVVKKIRLAKIKKYTVNVNAYSKRRKPKHVEHTEEYKQECCFEMTHDKSCYSRYTPIKGFFGNNQKELIKNIDDYCKDLIAFINTPIIECSKCCGHGIIVKE